MKRLGSSLLFWFMVLAGGGSAGACLLLPALLDHYAVQVEYAGRERELGELIRANERLDAQIEHIQYDPAYNERLLRREFAVTTPGVRMIPVGDSSRVVDDSPPALTWIERIQRAESSDPRVAVFALDATRPYVMAMGTVTMLVGIALLGPRRRASSVRSEPRR